jgi:Family of unknown function (DUF6152)
MKQANMKTILATLFLVVAFGTASQTRAHHSFAMFDNTKEVELQGSIKEFQWTNPHIWIQLMVNEGGKEVEYSIEGSSPNGLARRGWTRSILKPGDKIKIIIHPLKEGAAGGSFVKATLSDGRVLTSQGYEAP